MRRPLVSRGLVIVVLAAIVCSFVAAVLAYAHGVIAFRYRLLPFDHIAYIGDNALAYLQLETESRMALAAEWIARDFRGVLLQIFLLFGFPDALGVPFGYMFITVPMFAVGVATMAGLVWKRSGSPAYAIVVALAFCLLPFVFVFDRGLGAFLPDLSAYMLFLSAGCFLLLSERGQRLPMMVAFALAISVAIDIRYVSAIFAAVMFGPLVLFYLAAHYFRTRKLAQVAIRLGVVTVIPLVLCGYLLVTRFLPAIGLYSTQGPVGNTIAAAWSDFFARMMDFVGNGWILAAIGLIFVVNIIRAAPRWDWSSLAETIWPAVGHAITMILIMKTVGHQIISTYAFPFIFLAAVAPMRAAEPGGRWILPVWGPRAMRIGAIALAGLVVVLDLASYNGRMADAYKVSPTEAALKQLSIDLGARAVSEGDRTVWVTFFDLIAIRSSLEIYNLTGKMPMVAGEDPYFHVREVPLKEMYGGRGIAPSEAARLVLDRINRNVNLVVVYAHPEQAKESLLKNGIEGEYIVTISHDISQAVAADPGWEQAFVIKGTPYGDLAGYRNLRTDINPDAYQARLKGRQLP